MPAAGEAHPLAKLITSIMKSQENIYAIYTGHDDGSFFEIINLNLNSVIKSVFKAPLNARWAVIKIKGGQSYKITEFLDENFGNISSITEATTYDPRERPWYIKVMQENRLIRTDPYKFSNLKAVGVTYAKKVYFDKVVMGVDISLDSLSEVLKIEKVHVDNSIALIDPKGTVIADSGIYSTELFDIMRAKSVETTDIITKEFVEGEDYLFKTVRIEDGFWKDHRLVYSIPFNAMSSSYMRILKASFVVTLLLSMVVVPLIFFSTSIIVKPLKDLMRENELVSLCRFREVKPVKTIIKEYQDLSGSMVRMANDIESYQLSQQLLFDAFIKLIAEAIDDKSKYTGGHCERVPGLAEMLAMAASFSDDGVFADFKLDTEEKWRELFVGAWLHDCGKLVMPEYVVDKATKLETIYNRIHEIRTRFEVVLRDLEIEAYRKRIDGVPKDIADLWLESESEKLKDDFAFIARMNDGDNPVSDDDISRLKTIAEREWTRNFDCTLGLSYEESQRIKDISPATPAVKKLLDDKREHLIERINFDAEAFVNKGFKMVVPEYLYNLGEVYNLSVGRGTLTAEERFKINEHIIMSIKMLEKLPFPEHLKNVPEYACAHHETMIGTGYPRKLTKEEMSLPARMMAVADIFEALTAADRPYKKPKTLSESVKILSFMAKDKHIDEDIFRLFLKEGVYMEYAQMYLHPEQIDDVDVSKYI
jgi:HD-GYP domain-containing protein (c-di-GMP phosphodiesterase class II)